MAAEHVTELFATTARKHQLRAVAQYDAVLVMKPGLKLTDAVDVDYRRSVNAKELCGVELGFESADRFSQKVRLFAYVEPHIFAFGLYPIYLFGLDEKDSPARFDYQTAQVVRARFYLFEQGYRSLVQLAALLF